MPEPSRAPASAGDPAPGRERRERPTPARPHARVIVGAVLSAAALAWILKDVDLSDLGRKLAAAHHGWQIANVAALWAAMWIRALRWRALLGDRLPLGRSYHIQNAGSLLNYVLPLRIGEVGKAYLASRGSPLSMMQALSAVVIERLLDLLSVFAMLLTVLPWVPAGGPIVRAGQAAAALALLAGLGLFVAAWRREATLRIAVGLTAALPRAARERLIAWGDELLRGVGAVGGRRLAVAIAWSAVMWIGYGVSATVTLLSFVPDAAWQMGAFVTCAISLGLGIPSAPGGAGLYEAAAVAGLAVFGIDAETALAFALALHLSTFVVVAIAGIIGIDREGESFSHLASTVRRLRGRPPA